MATTEERLQELLDQKDERIEELEGKVSELEDELERDHAWTRHRYLDEDPYPGFSIPRIMVIHSDDAGETDCILFMKTYWGKVWAMPLAGSRTMGTPHSPLDKDGKFILSRRIFSDALAAAGDLNVPCVALWKDHVQDLADEVEKYRKQRDPG